MHVCIYIFILYMWSRFKSRVFVKGAIYDKTVIQVIFSFVYCHFEAKPSRTTLKGVDIIIVDITDKSFMAKGWFLELIEYVLTKGKAF